MLFDPLKRYFLAFRRGETTIFNINLIANRELNKAEFHRVMNNYYDDANDYNGQWSEQFDKIRQFSWVTLSVMPTWAVVNDTMMTIAGMNAENFDLNTYSAKVFAQYGFIKTFYCSDKLGEWKQVKRFQLNNDY